MCPMADPHMCLHLSLGGTEVYIFEICLIERAVRFSVMAQHYLYDMCMYTTSIHVGAPNSYVYATSALTLFMC